MAIAERSEKNVPPKKDPPSYIRRRVYIFLIPVNQPKRCSVNIYLAAGRWAQGVYVLRAVIAHRRGIDPRLQAKYPQCPVDRPVGSNTPCNDLRDASWYTSPGAAFKNVSVLFLVLQR